MIMTQNEHKAYKFAQKLQEMIKEKEFDKGQVRMILSLLLEENGYEGMADNLAANECDIRDLDECFLEGQFEGEEFGSIPFEQLSYALLSYTGRFSLAGLGKRKGRSKVYILDEAAAEKLVFIWRDTQSTADIENAGGEK